MKQFYNRFFSSLIILFLVISVFSPNTVFAQDGGTSPWGEVVDESGNIRFDNLTDLGETTEDTDWMDIPLPFGQELDLEANYHRYETPSGNVVVLPSPLTLVMMAMHPSESGLSDANSQVGVGGFAGAELLGALLGNNIDWNRVSLDRPQYVNPGDFWKAVIDGREQVWTWFSGFDFLTDLAKMSLADMNLRMGLLLYLKGAENCSKIPGGCSGVLGPWIKKNLPTTCLAPSVSVQQPSLSIQKRAPANPLVVGQDPEKRGADIQVTVSIPPVIYTWYEPIYKEEETCRGLVTGEVADCRQSETSKVNDGKKDTELVLVDCKQHIEQLPEPITSVQATAQLNAASRAWIVNQLAGQYYEAYVHRDKFNLIPGLGSYSSGCSGGTCTASALVERIPFADPGTFDLSLKVQTAGAKFQGSTITQPRLLSGQGAAKIFVTLTTLIDQP